MGISAQLRAQRRAERLGAQPQDTTVRGGSSAVVALHERLGRRFDVMASDPVLARKGACFACANCVVGWAVLPGDPSLARSVVAWCVESRWQAHPVLPLEVVARNQNTDLRGRSGCPGFVAS